MDYSRMRLTGRCLEDGGTLWMTFSLCEAAFHLKGATRLTLRFVTADPAEDAGRLNVAPRFAVDLDGKRRLDHRMTRGEESFSFGLEGNGGIHSVRVVKISECTQSILGLAAAETDGEMSPWEPQDRCIEFIGDSITCGYGVEAKSGGETFSTATENAEKSYAGLICAGLGAAPMLTAFSGYGLVSGYTADPGTANTDELVQPYYETFGRQEYVLPSGRRLQEIPWDFSRKRPEQIVLNLGTNDLSWCGTDPERAERFRQAYAAFLRTVRKRNPESRILCVLGLMGTGLNAAMEQAVEDYRKETGDGRIRSLAVPEQDVDRDGAGADMHPSERTQRRFAEVIRKALEQETAEM